MSTSQFLVNYFYFFLYKCYLLPTNLKMFCVEIALFFRDISAKVLKSEDVAILKENIAVKLCNLEKIFPPSFFYVMEHIVVHLPDEAT